MHPDLPNLSCIRCVAASSIPLTSRSCLGNLKELVGIFGYTLNIEDPDTLGLRAEGRGKVTRGGL